MQLAIMISVKIAKDIQSRKRYVFLGAIHKEL